MKKKPGVTVLMPCFNHEEYIEQAVASVLEQRVDIPVRLIIFDDCSKDKTGEIVEVIARANPRRVTLYKNEANLGSGLASIQSHRPRIDTEFWCILEGDDYWCDATKLQQQVNILRDDPMRVGCAGFTFHLLDDQPNGRIGSSLQEFNLADIALHGMSVPFYIHTSSILWRNIYHYNGLPFPKSFYVLKGDPALMASMMSMHHSIYRLDSTISVYRSTGKGRWSSLSHEDQRRFNEKYSKAIQKSWRYVYRLIRELKVRDQTKLLRICFGLRLLPAPINHEI